MTVALPTQKVKKRIDPRTIKLAIYGPNGIGKTPWAAQAEDFLYLASEPVNHVEGYIEVVKTWDHFHEMCKLYKAGGHNFKGLVLDTGPGFYRMLEENICAKNSVNHISKAEGGWNRGSKVANNTFFQYIQALAFLPYGLIFISHSRTVQVTPPAGEAYTKHVMDLPEEMAFQIRGLFDCILFCTMERAGATEDGKTPPWIPVIKTQASPLWEARNRHDYLPPTILMDPQPNRDGYSVFLKEFDAGRARKEKDEKGATAAAVAQAQKVEPQSKEAVSTKK